MTTLTGGCQCGAVRFSCESLGRASICHCRMCQKAFGGFFGPLVTVHGYRWTRGEPAYFASSDAARRGFCAHCGTPLTFEAKGMVDFAIGAFDEPAKISPTLQVNEQDMLPYVPGLHALPVLEGESRERALARWAKISTYQHPDHDTADWTPHP